MIKFLKKLFHKKENKPSNTVEPNAGEIWVFDPENQNPFKKQHVVKILAVKDGWVNYSMGGHIFNNESMKMDSFLYCFKLKDEA